MNLGRTVEISGLGEELDLVALLYPVGAEEVLAMVSLG
jgi:hypothetical protein